MKRLLSLGVAAGLLLSGSAELKDRFVFANWSLTTTADVDKTVALVEQAGRLGYTGLILHNEIQYFGVTDCWLDTEANRANLKRIKEACDAAGMDLVPCIWGAGYNTMLKADGNLAEGVPVDNVTYRVAADGKTATFVPEHTGLENLTNGGFEDGKTGWAIDGLGEYASFDTAVKCEGERSLRFDLSQPRVDAQARIMQKMPVKPNRRYYVRARVKTEGMDSTSGLQIAVYAVRDGKSFMLTQQRSFPIATTGDWTDMLTNVSTLDHEEITVYLGSWSSRQGRLWIDDVQLVEAGVDNPLRRPGCPFVVTSADASVTYADETDYTWTVKGHKNTTPVMLQIPAGSRISPGETLLVSAYCAHHMKDGSQSATCMSEPKLYDYFRQSAAALEELIHPKKWLLSQDEIRIGGVCKACADRQTDMAHILADCVTKQRDIIRALDAEAKIYMWGDMVDPSLNAHADHYMCPTTFDGCADLLPKDIVIINWENAGLAASQAYFREKGFRMIRSRSCDAGDWSQGVPAEIAEDVRTAAAEEACEGYVYTTWAQAYPEAKLSALSAALDAVDVSAVRAVTTWNKGVADPTAATWTDEEENPYTFKNDGTEIAVLKQINWSQGFWGGAKWYVYGLEFAAFASSDPRSYMGGNARFYIGAGGIGFPVAGSRYAFAGDNYADKIHLVADQTWTGPGEAGAASIAFGDDGHNNYAGYANGYLTADAGVKNLTIRDNLLVWMFYDNQLSDVAVRLERGGKIYLPTAWYSASTAMEYLPKLGARKLTIAGEGMKWVAGIKPSEALPMGAAWSWNAVLNPNLDAATLAPTLALEAGADIEVAKAKWSVPNLEVSGARATSTITGDLTWTGTTAVTLADGATLDLSGAAITYGDGFGLAVTGAGVINVSAIQRVDMGAALVCDPSVKILVDGEEEAPPDEGVITDDVVLESAITVGEGEVLRVAGNGLTAATTVTLAGGTIRFEKHGVVVSSPIVVTAGSFVEAPVEGMVVTLAGAVTCACTAEARAVAIPVEAGSETTATASVTGLWNLGPGTIVYGGGGTFATRKDRFVVTRDARVKLTGGTYGFTGAESRLNTESMLQMLPLVDGKGFGYGRHLTVCDGGRVTFAERMGAVVFVKGPKDGNKGNRTPWNPVFEVGSAGSVVIPYDTGMYLGSADNRVILRLTGGTFDASTLWSRVNVGDGYPAASADIELESGTMLLGSPIYRGNGSRSSGANSHSRGHLFWSGGTIKLTDKFPAGGLFANTDAKDACQRFSTRLSGDCTLDLTDLSREAFTNVVMGVDQSEWYGANATLAVKGDGKTLALAAVPNGIAYRLEGSARIEIPETGAAVYDYEKCSAYEAWNDYNDDIGKGPYSSLTEATVADTLAMSRLEVAGTNGVFAASAPRSLAVGEVVVTGEWFNHQTLVAAGSVAIGDLTFAAGSALKAVTNGCRTEPLALSGKLSLPEQMSFERVRGTVSSTQGVLVAAAGGITGTPSWTYRGGFELKVTDDGLTMIPRGTVMLVR